LDQPEQKLKLSSEIYCSHNL